MPGKKLGATPYRLASCVTGSSWTPTGTLVDVLSAPRYPLRLDISARRSA
jgi:hypothetical protein